MNPDLLQSIRTQAATLLDQPTEGLSPAELCASIQTGIAMEHAARKAQAGGACTLTLNGLLVLEAQLIGKPQVA
jgi:hypothetical protein